MRPFGAFILGVRQSFRRARAADLIRSMSDGVVSRKKPKRCRRGSHYTLRSSSHDDTAIKMQADCINPNRSAAVFFEIEVF